MLLGGHGVYLWWFFQGGENGIRFVDDVGHI